LIDKKVIDFERPQTWLSLVEKSLSNPDSYVQRLSDAEIDHSHSDCSGLDDVISYGELQSIIQTISENLNNYRLRLYHGCRLDDGDNPKLSGLKISSTKGIEQALIKIAQNDVVLKDYLERIKLETEDKFTKEQAECRNGQIWFCIRFKEIIEEGGVYCVFGSEYRLLILNSIGKRLKERLLYYGRPAIIILNLPIEPFLCNFRENTARYLFSLWVHHRLKLDDINFPTGFACWIKEDVPAEFIHEIIAPEKVYDQYNDDSRWYSWSEMKLT
jgi:hypothetical protein